MVVVPFVTLFLWVASSVAITVTSPSEGTIWTSSGPNTVTWSEVNTDPTSFAITLVQQGVFKQVLADNVDGTKDSLTITASLPMGNVFQVNIVKSSQDISTILAQSAQFNITSGVSSTASTGGSTVSSGSVSASNMPITSSGSATGSGTPTTVPISSSPITVQPTNSGALLTFQPSVYRELLVLTLLVIMIV